MSWIPKVFAHGFVVLSETAGCLHKSMDYFAAEHKRCIASNYPVLNIRWAGGLVPALFTKDLQGKTFTYVEVFA
jgi:dTDP-4-dehydrorhamnose 3,5-epimerase